MLLWQLESDYNSQHTPIYRDGILYYIDGVAFDDIYNNRQYAYDADVIISDEIFYNLKDLNSINALKIPNFQKNEGLPDTTSDLSYILKMKACGNKEPEIVKVLVPKVFELMKSSALGWTKKDYKRLAEQLYKVGLVDEGKRLDNKVNKLFSDNSKSNKTHSSIISIMNAGTDLVVPSNNCATCAKCSALQRRVYSISGNDKRFPQLPEYARIHGKFHENCRHRFFAFFDGCSKLFYYNDNGEKIDIDDVVSYSNRPYVDERTENEKAEYERFQQRRQNDLEFEQLKRDYYAYKGNCQDEKPMSFSKYLDAHNFKRITR